MNTIMSSTTYQFSIENSSVLNTEVRTWWIFHQLCQWSDEVLYDIQHVFESKNHPRFSEWKDKACLQQQYYYVVRNIFEIYVKYKW